MNTLLPEKAYQTVCQGPIKLATNKTKIVCTIGPASESPEILLEMIQAGMNIARLNFSHGDFNWHLNVIEKLRRAALLAGQRITILADLPGPKMRIGPLETESVYLNTGDLFNLTSETIMGNQNRVSVSFQNLASVVSPGDLLSLNDGIIQLEVLQVVGTDVQCQLRVGGELRSHKGINLPGISLGISAFTEHDKACLLFALENGVDAISQSFVETAADIDAVRLAANERGYDPFIIAKIERAAALSQIDAILRVSDGIMVARGDLGVETPLEQIAVIQKQLIRKANQLGKPVITATQMLASMVDHFRPTRAESTDVANAILDGSDCVMLSEESALGKFPVQAVKMLVMIASATEPSRSQLQTKMAFAEYKPTSDVNLVDYISRNVLHAVEQLAPLAVIVPTVSGYTARMVSRFMLPVWILGVSPHEATCHRLQFSYGVLPFYAPVHPADWNSFAKSWGQVAGLTEGVLVLARGPYPDQQKSNHRLEIIDLRPGHVWNQAPLTHSTDSVAIVAT